MGRRIVALLVTLILALLATPLAATAQHAQEVHRIGVLTAGSPVPPTQFVRTLHGSLEELGYAEGRNLAFEYRSWPRGSEPPHDLSRTLVNRRVDIIVALGTSAARAAGQVTRTVPIVMVSTWDPVAAGLVASLARPGGNITGVAALVSELNGKRLELLGEVVPGLARVAVLWNPADPDRGHAWKELEAAAAKLGMTLQSLEVRGLPDFESAVGRAMRFEAEALLVLIQGTLAAQERIPALAGERRLPAMYADRKFVDEWLKGFAGLMSYGPSSYDLSRHVASYVDRILNGADPGDLPVEQPSQFELVINLKTAKALGLTMPRSVLMRANEVIE